MDGDYYIELHVPHGVETLAPFLGTLPVDLELGSNEKTGAKVLVQSRVSTVAGIWCSKADGEWHTYDVAVHPKHPGDPDDVIRAFSHAFAAANLSHRCFSIIHDLDEDELLVTYVATT